jgi:hypothetical protein
MPPVAPARHPSGLKPCSAKAHSRRDNNDTRRRKERSMLDLVVLALALGFFALSVGYAIACNRL